MGGQAVDSDKLDGFHASSFARTDGAANTYTYASSAVQDFGFNSVIQQEIRNYRETFVDAGTGTNYPIDLVNGNIFKRTLSGTGTFTFPTGLTSGKCYSFTLLLSMGGTYTAVFPGSVKWTGAVTPTLRSTSSSVVDILTFFTIDVGSTWYGNLAIKNIGV